MGPFILLVCFVSFTFARCPLHGVDAGAFFEDESARPASASSSVCPTFSTTCCTETGFTEMANGDNAYFRAMNEKMSDVSEECDMAMKQLFCGVCSPDQSRIFTVYSYETDMLVCPAFAFHVFEACASSKVDGEQVAVQYSSKEEFLHSLLDGVVHVSVRHNENCYNPLKPPCKESDYVGVYSDCVDGFRTAFFSLPANVECQGGVPLPAPKENLPCNKGCPSGSYLPIGGRECEECPAGRFSIGGGVRMETWKEWPHGITALTYCVDYYDGVPVTGDRCKPWALNDTALTSGAIPDGVATVLQLSVELVRPGHVSFEWTVEAEECAYGACDGFYFELDGERLINFTSVASWTSSRFAVSEGTHTLLFVYAKDVSLSVGDDQALIDTLEISGMQWADSECSKCPSGSFSTQGSRVCQLCSFNTASDEQATPNECPACAGDQYALVGATSCSPRPECTVADYELLFTDCTYQAGAWTRDLVPTWIKPYVCAGGVQLPAGQSGLECAPCQAGFRRLAGYGDCVGCPSGQKAVGNECVACPAGSFAKKVFEVNHWNTWPDWAHHETLIPLSASLDHSCVGTGCLGDWRLMGDFIDSGVGHEFPAVSVLNFTADIEAVPSFMSYNISFDCARGCRLSVRVLKTSTGEVVYSTVHREFGSGVHRFELQSTGVHSFLFSFDGYTNYYSTEVAVGVLRLYNLRLSGARDGSAAECPACPAGSASGPAASSCEVCPAGASTNGEEGQQLPCPGCTANSVARVAGSSSCMECGRGTTPSSDHTQCLTTCVFQANDKTVFNVSGLQAGHSMFGPVIDDNSHQYYLSVCERFSEGDTPCLDEEGKHINSLACQVTNAHQGMSIGDFLAFVPFDGARLRQGFRLNFTHGTPCQNGKERSTSIAFYCDPDVVVGYPELPHGHQTVEQEACTYEFAWSTQFACPLCSEEDYLPVASECLGGKQQVSYVWRRPRRCHDGSDLPAPHEQSCDLSTKSCAAGEYAENGQTCKPTPPGTFSIGDGERVIVADDIPFGFDDGCQGKACESWKVEDGGVLKSGIPISLLRTTRTFIHDGSISFEYKFSGSPSAVFEFRVDGAVKFELHGEDIMLDWAHTPEMWVDKGFHTLEWHFEGGAKATSSMRDVEVVMRNITLHNNHYAPLHPIDCPAGFAQPLPGQSYCVRCGINEWSEAGTPACHACPPQQFSLPGAHTCAARDRCAPHLGYNAYFTPCVGGSRQKVWEVLEPLHCFQDPDDPATLLPESTSEECTAQDCPPGSVMGESGQCNACPKGSAPDESGACVQARAGWAAVPVVSYFDGFQPSSALLPGWRTGCSGLCGVRGWRARSHFMDSGFHGSEEVDVWITLEKEFVSAGSIEFSFSVDSEEDGLDFFIDGERQDVFRPTDSDGTRVAVQRLSFALEKGVHTFKWSFHQSDGVEGSVLVERVLLWGVEGGGSIMKDCAAGSFSGSDGATQCELCPAGQVADEEHSQKCEPCKVNHFQPLEGQSLCQVCPSGTFATSIGSTWCSTSCQYTDDESKVSWDLRSIGNALIGPVVPSALDSTAFNLQLCEPMTAASKCNDTHGHPVTTYVCEVDKATGHGVSAGSALRYGVTSDHKLELTFTGGSSEGCEGGQSRRTRVYFTCNPAVNGVYRVRLVYTEGCSKTFEVEALQGCRACDTDFTDPTRSNADYNVTVAECVSGSRTVTWVRQQLCMGPAYYSATFDCESELQVPYYSIAVVGGIVLLLLIGVLALVFRNRRIHQSYSQLLEQREGAPMGGLGGQGGTSMLDSLDLENGLDTVGTETL